MAYLPAQYFIDPQRFLLLSIYRLAALKSWPAVEAEADRDRHQH